MVQDSSRGAPNIPYWGWAGGALAAGGLYYAFTRKQQAEVESSPHSKHFCLPLPCFLSFHGIMQDLLQD